MSDDEDFHAWAKRVAEEEQAQKVRLTTFHFEGLPLMKGDTVPQLELHVDGKTFMLTNVTCIRGLEQGLVQLEGDVDKVTIETVELVQFKEDQAEIGFVKVDEDLHPSFKLNGVQTGRMSASEPNLANIPRAEPTDDDPDA